MTDRGVLRDRAAIPLRARSAVVLTVACLASLAAFLWPLFAAPTSGLPPSLAPVLFALVLPLVLAVVWAELVAHGMDVKALAMLGVLAAVGAAVRPLGAGTAGLEPVFFLLILGGRVFGPGFGFAQGALTLAASALLTAGVGPWLPYQMLAAGFVGLGAGLLPRGRGAGELAWLSGWALVSAFCYGWLMDFAFWPFAVGPASQFSFDPAAGAWENLHVFLLFNLGTSMGWNLGRGVTSVVLVLLAGPALLPVFRRAARRASFAP